MNKRGWLLLTVAVLLLLLAVVGLASKAFSASGPITVTATLTRSSQATVPPRGLKGDTVLQSWRINGRQGATLGRMLLSCKWILERARYCTGQIEMPRGILGVAGSSPSRFAGTYVVTGGTGDYLGAGGSMRFTAVDIRKTVLLVTITT
jgi:hypothetical protein